MGQDCSLVLGDELLENWVVCPENGTTVFAVEGSRNSGFVVRIKLSCDIRGRVCPKLISKVVLGKAYLHPRVSIGRRT